MMSESGVAGLRVGVLGCLSANGKALVQTLSKTFKLTVLMDADLDEVAIYMSLYQ